VPQSYGFDPDAGVTLLESFGATSLESFAAGCTPGERLAIYHEACALIPVLQRTRDSRRRVPAFARRLDASVFRHKAELFARVSLRATLGRPATQAESDVVRDAFAHIAAEAEAAPARLAHRDLQSSNLMVRPGAPAGARLGMIDFQGAFLAPPEYDAVCLLRDSYVELPDAEVDALARATREALPEPPDPERFEARFDLLTLARKGKDHARFLEVAEARGDRRYLRYLAPTLRYLKTAAARAAGRDARLTALAELLSALPESTCAR
jgi:aminoglycoside/choline kinase family phosphotransferase